MRLAAGSDMLDAEHLASLATCSVLVCVLCAVGILNKSPVEQKLKAHGMLVEFVLVSEMALNPKK